MLTSFVLFTTMLTACGDKSAATPSAAAERSQSHHGRTRGWESL